MNARSVSVQILLLAATTAVCGCSEHITAPPLEKITRVEVRDSGNHSIKTITDSAQIHAITEFVNLHREKWTKPFPDTPIPILVVNFYDNDQFVDHFGSGKTFFETQCGDDFCSQKASPTEIADFLRLIGENEALLNRR